MSDKEAQKIIERAIKEEDFREQLQHNFDEATAPYDLTDEEREALKAVNWTRPLPGGTGTQGDWVHVYKTNI